METHFFFFFFFFENKTGCSFSYPKCFNGIMVWMPHQYFYFVSKYLKEKISLFFSELTALKREINMKMSELLP